MNSSAYYDITNPGFGVGDKAGFITGFGNSYVGPAQSPNQFDSVNFPSGFATTSSGPGAISEASDATGTGVNDAYDGFGGVGLLPTGTYSGSGSAVVPSFGGLTVMRRVEVTQGPGGGTSAITTPFRNAGVQNAARFVETVTNGTGSTIAGNLTYFNNVGSDKNTRYIAAGPSGYVTYDPGTTSVMGSNQRYITSIQNPADGITTDAVNTVVFGNNDYTKNQVVITYANGDDHPYYAYPITVAPGQTVRVVLFSVVTGQTGENNETADAINADAALAASQAELITNGGNKISVTSPFFVGLTVDEMKTIINYDFVTTINFTSFSNTRNQLAAAGALDWNATPTGAGATLTSGLSGLLVENVPAAMDLLSGEGVSAAQTAAFRASSLVSSTISDQSWMWVSGNGDPSNSITVNDAPQALQYAPIAGAKGPIKVQAPKLAPPRTWRVWFNALGALDKTGAGSKFGSAAQTQRLFGGVLGLDYQLQSNLLLGVTAGGTDERFSVGARNTTGTAGGFHAGAYGVYATGGSYASANVVFSTFDNRTKRTIPAFASLLGETETGAFQSREWRARAEFGHTMDLGFVKVTPYAAMEVAQLRVNGFNEHSVDTTGASGIEGLAFADRTRVSLPLSLGARFEDRIVLSNGAALVPTLNAAWVHDFRTSRNVEASFQSLPGVSFIANGTPAAKDALLVKSGASLTMSDRVKVFANMEREFSTSSRMLAGKAGMQVTW